MAPDSIQVDFDIGCLSFGGFLNTLWRDGLQSVMTAFGLEHEPLPLWWTADFIKASASSRTELKEKWIISKFSCPRVISIPGCKAIIGMISLMQTCAAIKWFFPSCLRHENGASTERPRQKHAPTLLQIM